MRTPVPPLLPGLVMVFAAASSLAGEIQHRVQAGESASSIARDHYGRLEEGEFLLRYNGKSSTVLKVGEVLQVPYCEVHVVRPGDTWSTIARQYFRRPSIYPALAALNRIPADGPLHPGQELIMPVATAHLLQRGETLNLLAERYLGDPELHAAIQVFNDIADPRRLSTGQEIQIPVLPPRLQRSAAPPAPTTKSSPAPPPRRTPARPGPAAGPAEAAAEPIEPRDTPAPAASLPRFTEPLEEAGRAYTAGDFEKARAILQEQGPLIRTDGTREETAAYWQLLAFLEVAFDRIDAACDAFRSLQEVDGPVQFDPDRVSPKIRRVARSCSAG